MRSGMTGRGHVCFLVVVLCAAVFGAVAETSASPSVVVIVLDGLRPDYIKPDVMPNLHSLAGQGVVCEQHRAAYPTVTRVNAATIGTGCYPSHHGLLGNSMYIPEVDAEHVLSMANAEHLMRIDKATGGKLLTVPTLGEVLESHGKTLFVASAGSPGSAMLCNSKFSGAGVANVEMIRPESLKTELEAVIGPAPAEATPNREQNRWAVDAYLKYALTEIKPDVTIIWLSDPDHTAHEEGIGAPVTMEALRAVDNEVQRVVDGLRERGMEQSVDLIVMSDHGFSTDKGEDSLADILIDSGLKESKDSTEVVLAGDAIYVRDHDAERIRKIVTLLQKGSYAGAIFAAPNPSGPQSYQGEALPGTLSFSLIHWNHPRAADILVSPDWDEGRNEYGYPGITLKKGKAGHGSVNLYDLHATLLAVGPRMKSGARNPVPTGQIDIAPTICHLLGIEPPAHMDGRVLSEILKDGPDPSSVVMTSRGFTSHGASESGEFEMELLVWQVGRSEYLQSVRGGADEGTSSVVDGTVQKEVAR